MIRRNIGSRIRYYRELNGLTLRELAEKIGCSYRTIHSWETDRTEPKIGNIEDLCDVFGCKKSDILGPSIDSTQEENTSVIKALLREYIDQLTEEQAENLYKALTALRESKG